MKKIDRKYDKGILVGKCPDRVGIITYLTKWFAEHSGNILELDQHVDRSTGEFFIRIEWDMEGFDISRTDFPALFGKGVATPLSMKWDLAYSGDRPRIAIFVSQLSHCMWDIISRWQSGEWNVEIPLIIGNHSDFESTALRFGCKFRHVPISAETKTEQEKKELALLRDLKIDFIVLARYMQILSGDFVSQYSNRIINIHHSFLPAFAGANPYQRAHERGVKLIGASAHYVTPELDEGPIIQQDTVEVSHRDSVEDLIRKGRDVEKIVLSRAIYLHINKRIAVHGKRTVIFS